MEGLRIRIPKIDYCSVEDCYRLTPNSICKHCASKPFSESGVREEVSPATLPRQSQIVHSTPFRSFLRG
jgi:hypothetical protein